LILLDRTVSETTLDYPVAVRRLQPVDIHVFLSDSIRSRERGRGVLHGERGSIRCSSGRIDHGGDPVLFALAALSTAAREIVKDVEDMEDDREEGLRTLPIVIGARTSLVLAAIVLALAVLVSPVPFVRGTFGFAHLVLVIPCDPLMLYSVFRGLSNPTAGQSHLRCSMHLAAVAFVVGGATGLIG
jgi:hypothetical protein